MPEAGARLICFFMTRKCAFLLVTLLLAACSTPQPSLYAPKAGSEGYTEESLGKGLYRVSFEGNAVTSRERVQDYCLFRAAELTLERGATKFAVHDKLVERHTQVTREHYDPFPYYSPYWRHRYHRPYYGLAGSSGYRWERTTYLAQLTIEPFSGAAPGDSPEAFQVYDARATVEQFAPRIERPAQ